MECQSSHKYFEIIHKIFIFQLKLPIFLDQTPTFQFWLPIFSRNGFCNFCFQNPSANSDFKPSSKIFYGPFQDDTSFVDLLCFCSVLFLLCLCARLFICALWSPAGKGLTSWLSFVVSAVSLSLSHWYPGSGVVLDCIDS